MISLTDAHCDTIVKLYAEKKELLENDCHISLKKLLTYKTPLQFFAICLHPDENLLKQPFKNTLKIIDFFHDQIYKNCNLIDIVEKYEDLLFNRESNKVSALLSIEGGEALEGKLNNLNTFYELGVRSITLTWNPKNELGCGVSNAFGEGLSEFGKSVVKQMNSLGMIIDVSHLNEAGFWDVYELSDKPFIASHSNSKTICDHRRNLNDEQIKAIYKSNGVIGINIYDDFLSDNRSNVDDVIKHIDHIIKLSSVDTVGIGSDMDGADPLCLGINDVSDLIKIYQKLFNHYGEQIASKIMSQNFLRVVKDIIN